MCTGNDVFRDQLPRLMGEAGAGWSYEKYPYEWNEKKKDSSNTLLWCGHNNYKK